MWVAVDMNREVPTKENFLDPVVEKYLKKTYLFWKNQVKGKHEATNGRALRINFMCRGKLYVFEMPFLEFLSKF